MFTLAWVVSLAKSFCFSGACAVRLKGCLSIHASRSARAASTAWGFRKTIGTPTRGRQSQQVNEVATHVISRKVSIVLDLTAGTLPIINPSSDHPRRLIFRRPAVRAADGLWYLVSVSRAALTFRGEQSSLYLSLHPSSPRFSPRALSPCPPRSTALLQPIELLFAISLAALQPLIAPSREHES